MEGLEPPHLAASDPKSDVSTNFTTSGFICQTEKLIHKPCVSTNLPAGRQVSPHPVLSAKQKN